MNKERAIIHYHTAIMVFRKWLQQGIINEDEFMKIDAIIAGKYGLPNSSIYRESACYQRLLE